MNIIERIFSLVEDGKINNLPLLDDLNDDEIEDLYDFRLSDKNPIIKNGNELLLDEFYCKDLLQEEMHYVINNKYAICAYCGKIKDAKEEYRKADTYYNIEKYI